MSELSWWTAPHPDWQPGEDWPEEVPVVRYETTDELPAGVEAIELDGEPQQVVFLIGEHATLVTGDVLSGTGGRLHVFGDEADPERLLPALAALADLPIERVIIPHGDPILTDASARIRSAVAEARPA